MLGACYVQLSVIEEGDIFRILHSYIAIVANITCVEKRHCNSFLNI